MPCFKSSVQKESSHSPGMDKKSTPSMAQVSERNLLLSGKKCVDFLLQRH